MAKPKRRKATTKRRKNAARKTTSSAKRKAAARKAAATRKRKAAARSRAAKKAARTRKRRMSARKSTRKNPARKRRRSTAKRRHSASKSRKRSMAAKKAWRSRRRSNPTRARKRRSAVRRRRSASRRRNPANGMMGIFKQAVPAVAALYGARVVGAALTAGPLAGVASKVPANMGPAAVAALLAFGGHVATKRVKFLKKHRAGIMTGLGINLIDKIVGAVAPADMKAKLGVGDVDVYGLSDYVAVNGYVDMSGAPPIEDNIALSEYVGIGDVEYDLGSFEQEMGMMQDMGVEMDLGADHTDFADRHLGGFHRWQYRAPVGQKKYLAPVPPRSFTAPVPHMTPAYDASQRRALVGLYTIRPIGGFYSRGNSGGGFSFSWRGLK